MEKTKIVEITWLDTYHVGGSGLTGKEVAELRPVSSISYGRLIEDKDDYITIASSTMAQGIGGDQPEYREVTCIPRVVIQSIKELK
jgi:hypothetical protein